MTYRIKTNTLTWMIEPRGTEYVLKHSASAGFVPVDIYPDAEAAAFDVGQSNTGIPEWDNLFHVPAQFQLPLWVATED